MIQHTIDFGENHGHASVDEVKRVHRLLDEEKRLIVQDYLEVKKLEEEENIEAIAIDHFEELLQAILKTITYMEGYIKQLKDGDTMLKADDNVKQLANELKKLSSELEPLSKSLVREEEKRTQLAKHVKIILEKARKYQDLILQ